MARSGAPSKRRPDMGHLYRCDHAELVDGTVLSESVFWDARMGGVLLLDGSFTFYPASQVRRCWWDNDEGEDDE